MNLDLAKTICLAHYEYVINNIPNNYTPSEIGIAIDVIADNVDSVRYYTLMQYNLWRRGNLEHYPNNSIFNMETLKESINLC